MPTVHLWLTEAQHKALKEVAEREGLPLTTTIRILAMTAAATVSEDKDPASSPKTSTRQTHQLSAKPDGNVVTFRPAPKPSRATKR